jgi:hypothetical protein
MEHIAIDLGGRESQICIRNERGEILGEKRWATAELSRFLATRTAGARVLVESSAEASRRSFFSCASSTRRVRQGEAFRQPSNSPMNASERGARTRLPWTAGPLHSSVDA